MRIPSRIPPTALALLFVCAGCNSATAPGRTLEAFALSAIDQQSLPVRVGDETWLADTIRFREGDTWTRVQMLILNGTGATPDSVRWESRGTITRNGDRIVLTFHCPDGALCVAPDTVRRDGDGLIRYLNGYGSTEGAASLFRYDAVPPP